MKELKRDDFAIDAVTFQSKIRYSLISKYQTFDKQEIVHMVDMILKAQKIQKLKEEMKTIDLDKLEENFNSLFMNISESFSALRSVKEKIESAKI